MNIKSVSIAAVIGFVLSFLIGLISKNNILIVFVRAFIFGGVFALCVLLSSFVYSKFLSDSNPQDFSDKDDAPRTARPEGKVDIVIQGDNLEDDDGPKFAVDSSSRFQKQDFSPAAENPGNDAGGKLAESAESSQKEASSSDEAVSSAGVFTPVDLSKIAARGESEKSAVGLAEEKSPGSVSETAKTADVSSDSDSGSPKKMTAAVSEIDTLPDIGDFNLGGEDSSAGDIIDDSEFARESADSSKSFSGSSDTSAQNAGIMAQAIKTLLAKDN